MLNWNKLYELNDENNKKTGTYFENLALEYLSSVYRQYSWDQTQSSWDNNRDFVSLILDNIIGEAKYKKNCSSIEKDDVDPTILSGFLDGRISLIFLITNGNIPKTINERINNVGKRCGIKIVCITRTQLEYWLIANPHIYVTYFQEPLTYTETIEAVVIEKIWLESSYENTFESSYIIPEFVVDDICNLFITFNCSKECVLSFSSPENFPFEFIDTFDLSLKPGLYRKQYRVKLVQSTDEPIVFEFSQQNENIIKYVLNVKINRSEMISLTYSKQEKAKIEIFNAINTKSRAALNISIKGEHGVGKTTLLKSLAHDLNHQNIVCVLQFAENEYSKANCMKLCQAIMFFYCGELFQQEQDFSSDMINYYKKLIMQNNSEQIINNDLLIDIYSGCFDSIIAFSVINNIANNPRQIIKKSTFARKHILIVDDIHLLNIKEKTVFDMLSLQLKQYGSQYMVLIEARKFDYNISDYCLNGLEYSDVMDSLQNNISEECYCLFHNLVENKIYAPIDIITLITEINNIDPCLSPSEKINMYICESHGKHSFGYSQNLNEQERVIVSLIKQFSKGIDTALLIKCICDEDVIRKLTHLNCIFCSNGRIWSKFDCYSCFDKNNYDFNSNMVTNYLLALIHNAKMDPLFDVVQANALLMKIDKNKFDILKKKANEIVMKNIMSGKYYDAMLYGEVLCLGLLAEYTDAESLSALFYYGIALLHCDAQRRAIEIFSYVKRHSEIGSLVRYQAGAELINNYYSRFKIHDAMVDAKILCQELKHELTQISDENTDDTFKLRIAYSTAYNRLMMVYFLVGKYAEAQKTFQEFSDYNNSLPKCKYSPKYDSMYLEWQMDYSRGICIKSMQTAIEMDKICIEKFSSQIDLRRKILCEMDLWFFKAIFYQEYDACEKILLNGEKKLQENNFVNETVKVSIKLAYCRLMKYIKILGCNSIDKIEPYADSIYDELYKSQLENSLYIQGRTVYMLNNILAVLYLAQNKPETAKKLLEHNQNLIHECKSEYFIILNHNTTHLMQAQKIEWYITGENMRIDTYYLDPRIW